MSQFKIKGSSPLVFHPPHVHAFSPRQNPQLGILFYQLMLLTVLVEAPPLGSLVQGMGLFDSGWKDALNLGQEMVQSMKIRHAVALGAFLVGSMRQHEAIEHLASLRAGSNGQVRSAHQMKYITLVLSGGVGISRDSSPAVVRGA